MTEIFRALKPLKIGYQEFWIGETFSMPDDRDWLPLIKLELAELVNSEGEENPPPLEENESSMSEPTEPKYEIRPKGPAWFGVFLGEEQIGKSVRTQDEAEALLESVSNNEK